MSGPFTECALLALQPKSELRTWEWAEQEVYLDDKMNPGRAGYYDSGLTPYTRMLQEFEDLDEWDELHVEKSSRTGFTEAVLNVIRRKPFYNPGPTLFQIDTEREVRTVADVRLRPTIEAFAGELVDADDLTSLHYRLETMDILLSGGGSDSVLRNKALDLIVQDEVENFKMNVKIGEEGSSIDKARSRFTTLDTGGKLIVMSKPKLRGGIINAEVESGSLHKWFVPCPHCERFQVLEDVREEEEDSGRQFPRQLMFSHLKDLAGEYDLERFEKEVYWRCLYCNGEIHWHAHQRWMNDAGEWRPTHLRPAAFEKVPADERCFYKEGQPKPRKLTQRISDLNSPFKRVCWGKLAMMFVDALQNKVEGSLQHLFTNHLTVAWEAQMSSVSDAKLLRLRSGIRDKDGQRGPRYFFGTENRVCPVNPVSVIMATDRQDVVDKFGVAAIDKDLSLWFMDFGELVKSDEAVLGVFGREYPVLGFPDRVVSPAVGLIDAGFETFQTYDLSIKAQGMGVALFPSKGAPGVEGKIAQRVKPYRGRQLVRYDYNDFNLKLATYGDWMEPGKSVRRIWFPTDLKHFPDFMRELQAEKLVKNRNKSGYAMQEWLKNGDNDYGDVMKMLVAMVLILEPQLLAVIARMEAGKDAA